VRITEALLYLDANGLLALWAFGGRINLYRMNFLGGRFVQRLY
jgi:hypothetical protein